MAASTLEVLITGDASSLTVALNQGTQATQQFEQTAGAAAAKATGAFSSIGQTLKTLAPAFIAIGSAAVAGITKGISATQDWAADTRALQKVTGQTAEGASTLLASANLLGIGVDKLSSGFGILSKNIVNGAPNLEKYGIEVRDTTGAMLPFDDILGAVSDKFLELPAGPEQAAFAMNVFGRSGKDLIPILAKGREGMEELRVKAEQLGLVMSQDDVDAAKALSASQRELGLAFKGAAISLGQLFIPALTKVVNVATKVLEFFTRLPDPVKEVGVGLALAAGAVGVLTVAFSGLKSTFGPVIEGITSFGKALFESGLFETAGTALSSVSSAVTVVGDSVQTAGQQIQEGTSSASDGLTVVADAATVAATAAQASAVKTATSAGAFEAFGTKVGAAFSKLSTGFGAVVARIVSAAPQLLIITAIAAVIAGAAILIVKNWEKIKALFASIVAVLKPALNQVGAAFGQVKAAFGDVLAALGDAFHELGEALQPLLPLLKPIIVALGFIALSPILVMLKATTVALKVVAFLFEQSARGIEAFAHVIGPVVTTAIGFAVDAINDLIHGLNGIIGAYNKVAEASNSILGTNLPIIDTFDDIGIAASDAAPQVDALGGSLTDVGTTAAEAGRQFNAMVPNLRGITPLLDQMGTSARDFRAAAIDAGTTAADAIAQGATEGADAFQKFADQSIEAARQARDAFRDSMSQALTFTDDILSKLEARASQARSTLAGDTSDLTGTQLDQLRKQADLTARDILNTFRVATSRTKSFGRDLLELSKVGGRAGKDLATALATSGDVLSAQLIADAPQKLQEQIVTWFGRSEDAADTFASKLTNAIVGPLNDIKQILIQIAEKHFGLTLDLHDHGAKKHVKNLYDDLTDVTKARWEAHMALDTVDAENKRKTFEDHLRETTAHQWLAHLGVSPPNTTALDNLQERLQIMAATKYEVQVAVHTGTDSPWPEEALKQHLTDPMREMGFKQIGGRWTLPLAVAVHTDEGDLGGLKPKDLTLHVRADTKSAWDALNKLPESIGTAVDVDTDKANESLKGIANYPLGDLALRVLANAEQAWNAIRGVRDYDIPDKLLNIIIHTKSGSPWPDEVLKTRLTDPLRASGFKRVGDVWTLPLDVTAHSAMDAVTVPLQPLVSPIDPIASPVAKTGEHMNLGRLVQVTIDSRGILKDIRSVLRRMDAVGGRHHAGTSDVTGGIGHTGTGGTATSSSLDDALHRIVKLAEKSGMSAKESLDIVKRVSQQGADTTFIKKSVAMVADELGNSTAKLYGRALRRLDDATLHSDAKRAALIKAALEAQEALHHRRRPRLTQEERFDFPMHRIPQLPAGHTRIDPNRHELNVRLDRKHFDRQLAYDESYRGY